MPIFLSILFREELSWTGKGFVGDLESHDPDAMLEKYRKIQAEEEETREALKRK